MKKISFPISILFFCALTVVACKKEGPGGKSSVSGLVKHHTTPIPNAIVYIKYGAIEFPGADVNQYDASVPADGNSHYEFSGLEKGNYYLYGVGYDSIVMQTVVGGVGVRLKKNQALSTDVPVTE